MSRITYSNTTIFGKITAEAADSVVQHIAKLTRMKNVMDATIGSPADYTKLEGGDFGVGTGDGENFYNAIVALLDAGASVQPTISSLDMGG